MEITCTICQNNKNVVLKDGFLNRYRCNSCDHSFTVINEEQRTRYTEDYYVLKHPNWFNNPNYWLFEFIYTNIINLVKKRDIRLLDVGCGRGDFLKFIMKLNPDMRLYGIDLSDNYHQGISFMKGDFLKEGFSMKFDVICSLATIEHVDDIVLFVEKLDDLLLPEGLIIVMTVNAGGIFYKIARILKKIGLSRTYYSLYGLAHLQHFTNRSLKMLMERKGFEVILQKNHNYPIKAVDLPTDNLMMKRLYLLGIAIVFSLPGRFGVLQTIFCKRKVRK